MQTLLRAPINEIINIFILPWKSEQRKEIRLILLCHSGANEKEEKKKMEEEKKIQSKSSGNHYTTTKGRLLPAEREEVFIMRWTREIEMIKLDTGGLL